MDYELENLKRLVYNKKLVIWDFDGTIAKLNTDWLSCRNKIKEYLEPRYDLIKLDGLRVDQMEKLVYDKFGKDSLKDLIMKFRKNFEESSKVSFNQKLVEFISNLKNKNSVILSNNLKDTIEKALIEEGISSFFDDILGIDTFYEPKPNTCAINYLLNKYKYSTRDVILVGDNPQIDGETARLSNLEYFNISSL